MPMDEQRLTAEAATVCAACGLPPEEGPYSLPLCANCRDSLARRPFPAWVIVSLVLVVIALSFAFARFPGAIAVGVAFARGQRAEAAGDYAAAAAHYRDVATAFPDSTLALARLAVASHRAGDDAETVQLLGRLQGREMSEAMIEELDGVVADLERDYGTRGKGGRR